MGYYTNYKLGISSVDPLLLLSAVGEEQIIAEIRAIPTAEGALNKNGESGGAVKWYEHEDDMRHFSEKYPQLIFALSGAGEETEDMWKKYFVNGKMQIAKAVFTMAPFNPKELR